MGGRDLRSDEGVRKKTSVTLYAKRYGKMYGKYTYGGLPVFVKGQLEV